MINVYTNCAGVIAELRNLQVGINMGEFNNKKKLPLVECSWNS